MHTTKKRVVLVGTGGRAVMYVDALVSTFKDHCSLEAFCDLSQTRMDWHNLRINDMFSATPVPTYLATDFDRMIQEKKPDLVVVCTMDSTHHQYIVRAMELGCDVISEKPMTTDASRANAIFDAIQRTGRSLKVTHNVRYMPPVTRIRELIQQGTIGTPKFVSLQWTLDTRHGADYFRRWHREKDKSGGLLIHKASHHFDMINWWIDSYPQTVFAIGDLMFYGRKNAEARGEKYDYTRYTGQPQAKDDPFAIFLDNDCPTDKVSVPGMRGLYLNAEAETGYIRDQNVFGEGITAEDVMSITARYRNGVILNYSLIAFSPTEGFRATITGDKGSIEIFYGMGSHVIRGQSNGEMAKEMASQERYIRVHPMFAASYEVEVPEAEGSHGGGDDVLLRELFAPDPSAADPTGRTASHIDGAATVLLGIAANESIRTGRAIRCDDLLKLPEKPQKH